MLRRLEGHTLDHAAMPDAVRLEVPDWLLPSHRCQRAAGPARARPLDLRVNLLKARATKPVPRSPPRAWTRRQHRTLPGAFASRAAARSPPAPPSAPAWWRSRTKAASSSLRLVDARPGMRVADLCAGAGGKTLALAMTMQNRGQLVACDVSAARLEGAVRRLRRAGVHNVERHSWNPATSGSSAGPRPSTVCWWMRPAPAPAPGGATPTPGCASPRPTLPNFCQSRRRSSIRPPRWFARAGIWSTLRVRCSPRRTRIR